MKTFFHLQQLFQQILTSGILCLSIRHYFISVIFWWTVVHQHIHSSTGYLCLFLLQWITSWNIECPVMIIRLIRTAINCNCQQFYRFILFMIFSLSFMVPSVPSLGVIVLIQSDIRFPAMSTANLNLFCFSNKSPIQSLYDLTCSHVLLLVKSPS